MYFLLFVYGDRVHFTPLFRVQRHGPVLVHLASFSSSLVVHALFSEPIDHHVLGYSLLAFP